jgi:hypothetical protein
MVDIPGTFRRIVNDLPAVETLTGFGRIVGMTRKRTIAVGQNSRAESTAGREPAPPQKAWTVMGLSLVFKTGVTQI